MEERKLGVVIKDIVVWWFGVCIRSRLEEEKGRVVENGSETIHWTVFCILARTTSIILCVHEP